MPDSFAYSPETVGQAREIYELLAKRVSNRLLAPITYGLMADRIGTHPRALKHPLAKIQDECSAKGYPTITVLIVDQETGLPNSGCAAYGKSAVEQERAKLLEVEWPEKAWW